MELVTRTTYKYYYSQGNEYRNDKILSLDFGCNQTSLISTDKAFTLLRIMETQRIKNVNVEIAGSYSY